MGKNQDPRSGINMNHVPSFYNFEKKFLLVSSRAACGFKIRGSAVLLVVLMETSTRTTPYLTQGP
jgi:hypothetical protein